MHTDLSWFSSWVRSVLMALAGGVVLIGGILVAWKPKKLDIVVAV
jgi:hypothetical protein